MTQILILLTMALQLLVAVSNPNVPDSLRQTAISTANYAIEVANKAMIEAKKPQFSPTPSPTPLPSPTPSVSPILGAISPSPTPYQPFYEPTYYQPIVLSPTSMPPTPTPKPTPYGELVLTIKPVSDSYSINVLVLGEGAERNDSKHSDGTSAIEYRVIMESSDGIKDIRQVGKQGTWINDPNGTWNTNFPYTPQSSGKKTLIFTSGSLTKTIEIDVK